MGAAGAAWGGMGGGGKPGAAGGGGRGAGLFCWIRAATPTTQPSASRAPSGWLGAGGAGARGVSQIAAGGPTPVHSALGAGTWRRFDGAAARMPVE